MGLVSQNDNAYLEGFNREALETLQPLWTKRTPAAEAAARAVFSPQGVRVQYLAGARDPEAVSPDAWTHDLALLARPGNGAIQLDLLADYKSNLESYPDWRDYFRRHRPDTLIVWGRNDPIFLAAGAEAYRRDLPEADLVYLDGGHFALEEYPAEIASHIVRVFAGDRSADAG
jgi:pimeloyl-ACP methyl ester carboxylesterase